MGNKISKTKKTILVLGANGKTGSRVMERLNKLNWPVRKGSRSGNPKFDWDDNETWIPALQDVNAVYISYYPDVAIPGVTEKIQQFVNTAVRQGVRQLVLLSGRGEEEAQACENIVINSGVDWTIVRASWFNQNFSEGSFLEPILAGHVALPAGDVGEPFVDADDIADVAVAALTEEGHNSEIYEVTGPRLLTFKEAVGEIADATGRNIQYEQVSMADYAAVLKQYQLPDDIIWLVTYLFSEVLDGRNSNVTDGVERALGRKPTDFSEFIKKTLAAGAWDKDTVKR